MSFLPARHSPAGAGRRRVAMRKSSLRSQTQLFLRNRPSIQIARTRCEQRLAAIMSPINLIRSSSFAKASADTEERRFLRSENANYFKTPFAKSVVSGKRGPDWP